MWKKMFVKTIGNNYKPSHKYRYAFTPALRKKVEEFHSFVAIGAESQGIQGGRWSLTLSSCYLYRLWWIGYPDWLSSSSWVASYWEFFRQSQAGLKSANYCSPAKLSVRLWCGYIFSSHSTYRVEGKSFSSGISVHSMYNFL